jgi:hypothetical protein
MSKYNLDKSGEGTGNIFYFYVRQWWRCIFKQIKIKNAQGCNSGITKWKIWNGKLNKGT